MPSDFQLLAEISESLQADYISDENDPWAESPFRWIKTLPSRTVGAVGERLVHEWAESQKFTVKRTGDSDADRLIANKRVEIKCSTLWKNGVFKFQQIRDQNYDFCVCLGIEPHKVHAWIIPKAELMEDKPGLSHQHGGAAGTDTRWLSFEANNPPVWLAEFGGTLTKVANLLNEYTKND
jgi:hypothetical protein